MTFRIAPRFRALALACLAALPAAPAAAGGDSPVWRAAAGDAPGAPAPGASATAQRSRLHLLPGWRTESGARMAGLRIALDPGWKTYWRVPGEAGIPPAFDWSESENVARVEVRWPRPVAFESFGMTTLGYKSRVVLPLEVTPEDPAAPMRLRLSFAYGVCSDICMPESARLALDLAPEAEGARAPIAEALARQPRAAEAAGARMTRCALRAGEDGRRLEAELELAEAPAAPRTAVVEAPEPLWFAPAQTRAQGARLRVTAPVDPASRPGWMDRGAVRITVIGPDQAVEFTGCRD